MKLEYHSDFQKDFNEAVVYYEARGGLALVERFEAEFRVCILAIRAYSTRFPFYQNNPDFRRARLKNFPYTIAYREELGIYPDPVPKARSASPALRTPAPMKRFRAK